MSGPVVLARTAAVSECGRYRYDLGRVLEGGEGTVAFVLLNPSIADDQKDDPTVRRCIGYAHRWGYRNLSVVNLFGLRSTDPAALRDATDPVGPLNDQYLDALTAPAAACRVVLGWGVHGAFRGRGVDVESRIRQRRQALHPRGEFVTNTHVFGRTASGEPRHPLYLRAEVEPVMIGLNESRRKRL